MKCADSTRMWTFEDGLELVRTLQPGTRKYGYHLTLGGSVLNFGFSEKDLDLFFIPLDNGLGCDPEGLERWLREFFNDNIEKLGSYGGGDGVHRKKLKASYLGQRVDVFIS